MDQLQLARWVGTVHPLSSRHSEWKLVRILVIQRNPEIFLGSKDHPEPSQVDEPGLPQVEIPQMPEKDWERFTASQWPQELRKDHRWACWAGGRAASGSASSYAASGGRGIGGGRDRRGRHGAGTSFAAKGGPRGKATYTHEEPVYHLFLKENTVLFIKNRCQMASRSLGM